MAPTRAPRADLPSGTVTLLFTDIEGSTQLLRRLGARYAEVQDRHRQLLRAAFDTFGGVEIDTQGDAFMVAFPSAAGAAAAAVQSQRELAAERWPEGGGVSVRMGLHTGEPERGPEGYIGMDVHIAARICGAGHGGQILVSRATQEVLAKGHGEVSLRPLGSHRLKDVPAPEQLFQLIAPGLLESFPPVRTLSGATLPALHHRLVGRRADLTATLSLLARSDVRLVTITGPGGAGKSRLALEVAGLAAVERPVHLVGLAPVSDPDLVPAAIARALGVRESSERPVAQTVADALSGDGALLVLDNLEHLPAAAHHLAELLHRTPGLDILTTSRAPLRLSGEHVVPLAPLPVHDASTLFSELAAARGVLLREDALSAVREICRRLDGLPLAIELVAARLAVLPPEQLLRALDEGLTLDMEGPVDLPERQRTLRATIDWSYRLLSESQQDLHQTLAVFVGGCTLDDGQALAGSGSSFYADLEALVAGSLVRSDVTDGDVRLFMLETVREDAVARLVAGGRLDELRHRHAERFLELAAVAEDELARSEQARWLNRLEGELDNLRAAMDWLLLSGRVEDALRAVSGLSRFWRAHGHAAEARRWLAAGLGLLEGVASDVRADAFWTAARQAAAQSDWSGADAHLRAALPLFRESRRDREVVFTLSELAFIALRGGDLDGAATLCEEALEIATALDDPRATSAAHLALGEVRSLQGDHAQAIAHDEEAVTVRRRLGDPLLITDAVHNLGWVAFVAGDLDRARAAFEESLVLARELGEAIHTAEALKVLGELDLFDGELDGAEGRIRESLALYSELDADLERAACLVALGGVAAARGALDEAARLFDEADVLRGDAIPEAPERAVLERFRGAGGVGSMPVPKRRVLDER
ncbi:MAG: tetratricopeptide repeat protein [Gaiellaceae bacterium]